MNTIATNYLSVNKYLYFLLLCLGYILMIFITQEFILYDELYYQALNHQMSYERIENFLTQQKQLSWYGYAFIPLVFLIKFFLVTVCLFTGAILFDIKASFKKFFELTILAETVFLIPVAITIFWFSLIQPDYSLSDIQSFYPLSLINIFNPEVLPSWIIYPLQLLNVFELIYILFLGYSMSVTTKKSFLSGVGFVISTYGVGLMIWVIVIAFITINLS